MVPGPQRYTEMTGLRRFKSITGAAAALALALALLLALALPPASEAAKRGKESGEQLYVSLGDSYAVGYQPGAPGYPGAATKRGFADVTVKLARKRGYDLDLVNFGCGRTDPASQPTPSVGETTTSILERTAPCLAPAIGGPNYAGRTQADAATRFLKKHRGEVELVTVSIGGNDVTACATASNQVGCVVEAVERIKANLAVLVQRLRSAAGPNVQIVGLTYPDVILGAWVSGEQSDQDLARRSVGVFRDVLNPALKEGYESVAGIFVDVTAATGAYGSLDELTSYPPYGDIPVPVATICRISYFCEIRDIHLKDEGYRIIAELIANTLPKKKKEK
jgi:lysophospholipase L1-like esterase